MQQFGEDFYNQNIILGPCGTQPHTFVGIKKISGGSKRIKDSFIVRLFRNNEHPFPGLSFLSFSCKLT